jgi:hypothetical protein
LKEENFDSLERKILTVWKGKFWQFEKGNFDSLNKKNLKVWKGKFCLGSCKKKNFKNSHIFGKFFIGIRTHDYSKLLDCSLYN